MNNKRPCWSSFRTFVTQRYETYVSITFRMDKLMNVFGDAGAPKRLPKDVLKMFGDVVLLARATHALAASTIQSTYLPLQFS